MLWPESASEAIARALYDWHFDIYRVETELDEEGGAVRSVEHKGEAMGNARFSNFSLNPDEIGLKTQISVEIHAPRNTDIFAGDIIEIDGLRCDVVSVMPHDSHLKIFGAKNA